MRVVGCMIALGDIGGDATVCFGNRGNGEPSGLSVGRGLEGRPGLISGEPIEPTLLLAIMELSEFVGLSIAFSELAGGCRGERGKPATRGLNCRGDSGAASTCACGRSAASSSAGDGLPLLSLFFFFDLLRACSSLTAKASRTRSSSSRVFLRPRCSIMGISSTSRVSS